MEECLVLDLRNAWVMQVASVHEAAWSHKHLIICTSSWVAWDWFVLLRFLSTWLLNLLTTLVRCLLVIHQASELWWRLGTLVNFFRRVINRVFACVAIKWSFHQEIEEVACRSVICNMTVQVNSPEEWMSIRWSWVRERNQIYSNMANNTLRIKHLTNRAANRFHIHIGQWLLGEEAASIHVLLSLEFVHWA